MYDQIADEIYASKLDPLCKPALYLDKLIKINYFSSIWTMHN